MSSGQWREKAGDFFSSSSVKLKQATQVAGEVAKTAGSSVADAAERAGSVVRSRWSLLQQQQSKDGGPTVQTRLRSASTVLKKNLLETKEKVAIGLVDTREKVSIGLSDTKEKVAIGRVKVEEIAKRATQRSKVLLANIDWWQKGPDEKAVFGVPLEILVQRQKSPRPIPQIVIKCVDCLVKSGLHAEYLFKQDGDQVMLDRLVNSCHEDSNAILPDGASPIDVAALLKLYLRMLPEPVLTFELYDEIVDARGSARLLHQYLATLPAANYSTLECLTALLLRISQKSALNKMDAHSLAIELAPALLWRKNKVSSSESLNGEESQKVSSGARASRRLSGAKSARGSGEEATEDSKGLPLVKPTSVSVRVNVQAGADDEWSEFQGEGLLNGGSEDEKSAQIPLDDEPSSLDLAVVEAVQCLIEHHDVVFADAIEAVWQEIGG